MLGVRTGTNSEQTDTRSKVTTQPKRVFSLFLGILVCGLGTRFSSLIVLNEQQRTLSEAIDVLAGPTTKIARIDTVSRVQPTTTGGANTSIPIEYNEDVSSVHNSSIPETAVTRMRSPAHPPNETRIVVVNRDDHSLVNRGSLRETVRMISPREDGLSSGHEESVQDTVATGLRRPPAEALRRPETTATGRGLPSLDALTSFPENITCPKGYVLLENTVLPKNITHAGRKIPKVVHVTAKSRCVTNRVRKSIRKWKLPDHSLYFHDDEAVFKLLEYTTNDRYGNELIRRLSESLMCITSGPTLSDFWRYALLYHYGGIYTDMDNAPGDNYTTDFIRPDTDAFFFVESTGTMSQYYMASSRHHPVLLHFLSSASRQLLRVPNVMVNNPAYNTGPGAVKRGSIGFLAGVNVSSDGYLSEGVHRGGAGSSLLSELPWWYPDHGRGEEPAVGDDDVGGGEYPSASDWRNRTVTVFGNKRHSKRYVQRASIRRKDYEYRRMNMTHYHGGSKKFPRSNRISCEQHVSRMMTLVAMNTSFYHNKSKLPDLLPRYEFRKESKHYFDQNTQEKLIPW